MVQYYTLAQLKQLALKNAQRYRPEYDDSDVTNAYASACALAGFENPASSDVTDYALMQYWLIQLMNLYFYKDIYDRYLLHHDIADLKVNQVLKNIEKSIDKLEKAFKDTKDDPKTAHLFMDGEAYFSTMVYGSGIKDDAVGVDLRDE